MKIKKFKNQKITSGFAVGACPVVKSFKTSTAGFTLIEMVTVIAIFVVVTGIILANLPSFRSSSALDLVAQEVATQVRGAQVYAMSTVVSNTTDNIFGYLLQIPVTGDKKDFRLCACKLNPEDYFGCRNSCVSNIVESYRLGGKVTFTGSAINLYFKRPMGSLFCRSSAPGTPIVPCPTVTTISVTDGVNSRYIKVGNSGSISISSVAP